ncbi:uncharacterized protein [Heterodontus francisci]|uniref:uncharacterized protein isoform X2 n=1 Tax=Heterodontus francisci TaxID=7792 RepID=UPI00355C6B88
MKMTMNVVCVPVSIITSYLFLMGVHSDSEIVRQTPQLIQLVESKNVVMDCTINFAGPKTYKWLKNGLPVSQTIPKYNERVAESMRESENQKVLLLSLRIRNLTECDSGKYYCTMENLGKIKKGAGTTLTVTRVSQEVQCVPINIIHIGVSAGVIAVLCVSLIVVSVRLIQRNKACIVLQRQFVAYITEKSTGSVPSNQERKHKRGQSFDLQSRGKEEEKKSKAGSPDGQ